MGRDEDPLALRVVLRSSSTTQHLNKTHHHILRHTHRTWYGVLSMPTQISCDGKERSSEHLNALHSGAFQLVSRIYLQDVQGTQLSPAAFLGAVNLRPFDDDRVSREVNTPS